MKKYTEINTACMNSPTLMGSLLSNRCAVVNLEHCEHEVTLIITAYNRLEKVKKCVESVLRYTQELDYELILVDNGSEDGTLEYFLSVQYKHKRIIRITKNLGAFFPLMNIEFDTLGNFVCCLNDDALVTPHWLDNLLTCIKSDLRIALASPMYCSPCYDIDDITTLTFTSYEDMLQKSEIYNISDSRKWWDMVRPSTFCALFRKEAILSIGWPYWDVGFHHEFADDDVGFRLRRMGYRTLKAGDTWIYHDHNIQDDSEKNEILFKSFEEGQERFKEKYFGVKWKNYANFYFQYLRQLPTPYITEKMSILGVDVGCGTPALDVKNWLISWGASDVEMSAFTRDPKFWVDLQTICSGNVVCDREEFLLSDFPTETFDYVVTDNPINCYHDPQVMLQTLFRLCKKRGYVVCKLFNAFSFREYLTILEGQGEYTARKISYNISVERFREMLESYGAIKRQFDMVSTQAHDLCLLQEALPDRLTAEQKRAAEEMRKCAYMFVVEKT